MALLSLIINTHLSAQTGAKFGFRGGYSMSTQYGVDNPDIAYTVQSKYRHGFVGGLLVFFPITESFGVQQEFLYTMKGSIEEITYTDFSIFIHSEYDLNYFEIPIVFRYTFVKFWGIKIYGCSGFALSILLNGEQRIDGTVEIGSKVTPFTYSDQLKGVDIFDYAFLYGAGVDFNFFNQKCFLEYRFSIGWNTLMVPTSNSKDVALLRNQDYIFTLGMYF